MIYCAVCEGRELMYHKSRQVRKSVIKSGRFLLSDLLSSRASAARMRKCVFRTADAAEGRAEHVFRPGVELS